MQVEMLEFDSFKGLYKDYICPILHDVVVGQKHG